MSIRLLKQYEIICDFCGDVTISSHGDNGVWTRSQLEIWLRKIGWTIGNKTKCPACSHKN